jgi:uncharacterized membrane protein
MIAYAVRTTRARAEFAAAPGMPGDPALAECWNKGVFYNNPNDTRLWVEKGDGMGWTLNMAHRAARWVLAGILAFIAVDILIALLIGWAVSR